MSDSFFDHPIFNSPYTYPARHWELDESGQPTQKIIERRRRQPTPISRRLPEAMRRAPRGLGVAATSKAVK